MSWVKTHTITVKDIKPHQIWQVWSDVNNWHLWDTDIEFAHLDGGFEKGSIFSLKPKGGPKVAIEIIDAIPNKSFTDCTKFPLAKMYGTHQMQEGTDGLTLTVSVKVTGLLGYLWRKLVAEKVAQGIPEQTQKLLELAATKK
jgi:hypothetical protein